MSNESPFEIDVLYEDADIVAVNKPSGLMVHGDGRNKGPFLTDWISRKFPEAVGVGEPARAWRNKSKKSDDAETKEKSEDSEDMTTREALDIARPGIVHRLDRDTSGVILIAKTQGGFECLKAQFQARTIKKKYLAFVWGELKEEFGTIDKPIGRSGSDFRKWSAQRGARGEMRQAETYWSKVKGESVKVKGEDGQEREESFTLIEAEPKTGRTHQIRVHFAAIQHPIVGDALYAPKKPAALGFTRTALHSRSIEFDNCEGRRVKIEAPLPDDFETAKKSFDLQ